MEVFSVFATMSLVDMISNPLKRINGTVEGVSGQMKSLSGRLGALASAMIPVAIASGILLGSFLACVGTAAGFEDQMAKVGAISRASAEDMKLLEASARELGATTQFTAIQAAQGQQYLAMAGFSAAENIAALPAVLNMAAATATDLGRAADISSDILGAFGLEAQDMTRVADVLSLTCATANTNMELLGDSMKYVAPIARKAGMSIEETAAMVGLLGNIGIKGSQAGTSLKAMLTKLSAPSAEATELFKNLGIQIQDTNGNLRSPIAVMGELAEKMKGMGTAQQIAAMKMVAGEEAISGLSELIEKQGVGAISDYVKILDAAGGSAEEMALRMNDTLMGSLRSMGSAWESVKISIGQIFIPIARKAVDVITLIVRSVDGFVQNPIGEFLISLLATISSFVVSLALFAGAWWGIAKILPMIGTSISTLKVAFLGLGAPIIALIAAIGLLYIAYQNNFGGIADTLDGFFSQVSLVFRGVVAIFKNLTGSVFEIQGELAQEIHASGLTNLVTSVASVVYRLKEIFVSAWEVIASAGQMAWSILAPCLESLIAGIGSLIRFIGGLGGAATDAASNTGVENWQAFGSYIGYFVVIMAAAKIGMLAWHGAMLVGAGITKAMAAAQWIFNSALLANPIVWLIIVIIAALVLMFIYWDELVEIVLGAWSAISSAASIAWDFIFGSISSGIDSICGFFTSFWETLCLGFSTASATIVGVFSSLWSSITGFFSGINLYDSGVALLSTFKDGIMGSFTAVKDTVSEALQSVRNLLPFSDAKEGPLSTLTLSGASLLNTIGQGVTSAAPNLMATMNSAFSGMLGGLDGIGLDMGSWFNGLFDDDPAEKAMNSTDNAMGKNTIADDKKNETAYTINIANINLPGVENGKDFIEQLQAELTTFGI